MTTLAEHMIVVGADNRPPMLEKSMYNSWSSRMLLYIKGKEHTRIMLNSVLEGPHVYGLPPDVYSLVNHHSVAKQIWDRVKLLMKGTELIQQECECKLYNEFDRDDNAASPINTKFLNSLLPEKSKFVNNVKLAKDMHESNYDQLYAYLSQQEAHAIEVYVMCERFSDSLTLVTNYPHIPSYQNNHQPQYNLTHYQQQLSPVAQQYYSSQQHSQSYETPSHYQQYQPPASPQQPLVPKNVHQSTVNSQQQHSEFLRLDSVLAVPSFLPGDDPIASLNKVMTFLTTAITSCFPPTNNQLRTSCNPRNQAIIQDGMVTVQQV
ncbi:hypothetical protein Tco_0438906 [Tanacetum coccineum]